MKLMGRKHGGACRGRESSEYRAWQAMKSRCRSKRPELIRCYAGRGIYVHPKWETSFESFLAHVGKRPAKGWTIDRINNDQAYIPGNVRWADKKTQARNTRAIRQLSIGGITRPETEWAESAGLPITTLRNRVKRGWPEQELLSKKMWKHRVGRCV